ncbi:MAG TPA: pyruvate kinase [Vicinamibacterales bacterium]|jgi:pyruvate kinase|nr:pyruvate kinase [Vicinamibacterales bacterium]
MRQTKIVATVGPSSDSDETIRALIAAGTDVFRLNFSHGTHETHGAAMARIRAAAQEADRYVAIMQDLSGPKIRTGELKNHQPIELTAGNALRIVIGDEPGDSSMVSTTYDLAKAVSPGSALLLDDGHIQLRVEGVEGHELRTSVVEGGTLGEHKGINVPGVVLPAGALTPKDVDDLNFGARAGVDYVALSFVQTAEDLRQARAALAKAGTPRISLVAKLERPEAVAHIDDILAACDAIMVARGDLGLELPLERVPRVQKEVTRKARARAIPVIVATQVLESMRTESRPTRAEVSDAANAVDDGVDAIMLAGETAAGKFPVRTVQTLDLIIRDAEQMPPHVTSMLEETHLLSGPGRALCEAALTLAGRSDAAAIVAVTRGGKTARVLSALHPRAPIYAATNSANVARQLALVWGVTPLVCDLGFDTRLAIDRISEMLVTRSFIAPSSVIVVVSISPDLSHGSSNFLKLERV